MTSTKVMSSLLGVVVVISLQTTDTTRSPTPPQTPCDISLRGTHEDSSRPPGAWGDPQTHVYGPSGEKALLSSERWSLFYPELRLPGGRRAEEPPFRIRELVPARAVRGP